MKRRLVYSIVNDEPKPSEIHFRRFTSSRASLKKRWKKTAEPISECFGHGCFDCDGSRSSPPKVSREFFARPSEFAQKSGSPSNRHQQPLLAHTASRRIVLAKYKWWVYAGVPHVAIAVLIYSSAWQFSHELNPAMQEDVGSP